MKTVHEAKIQYITNVDNQDPMSLEVLSEQTGVPLELLKQAHKRENWQGHWNRNRDRFLETQTNAIARRVEEAGLEVGKVAGDILRKNIEVSLAGLTLVQERLLDEIPDMNHTNLLAAAKFFSSMGMEALRMLKDVYQVLKDDDSVTDTHKTKFKNLTVRVASELKDAMDNSDSGLDPEFDKERAEIFRALDAEA